MAAAPDDLGAAPTRSMSVYGVNTLTYWLSTTLPSSEKVKLDVMSPVAPLNSPSPSVTLHITVPWLRPDAGLGPMWLPRY